MNVLKLHIAISSTLFASIDLQVFDYSYLQALQRMQSIP